MTNRSNLCFFPLSFTSMQFKNHCVSLFPNPSFSAELMRAAGDHLQPFPGSDPSPAAIYGVDIVLREKGLQPQIYGFHSSPLARDKHAAGFSRLVQLLATEEPARFAKQHEMELIQLVWWHAYILSSPKLLSKHFLPNFFRKRGAIFICFSRKRGAIFIRFSWFIDSIFTHWSLNWKCTPVFMTYHKSLITEVAFVLMPFQLACP